VLQPIANIDGAPLKQVAGPVSTRLGAAFRDLVARDLDP
jgi:hypothetical protein